MLYIIFSLFGLIFKLKFLIFHVIFRVYFGVCWRRLLAEPEMDRFWNNRSLKGKGRHELFHIGSSCTIWIYEEKFYCHHKKFVTKMQNDIDAIPVSPQLMTFQLHFQGYFLLRDLAAKVGAEKFNGMIKAFVSQFHGQLVRSQVSTKSGSSPGLCRATLLLELGFSNHVLPRGPMLAWYFHYTTVDIVLFYHWTAELDDLH